MTDVNLRVQKHRDGVHRAGLRPVQIWVPDTRQAGFEQACQRQCHAATQADNADTDLHDLMDTALADMRDNTRSETTGQTP